MDQKQLSKLSVTDLKRLKSRVEAEISRRTDSTRKDLLKKIQKMASDAGLSINDVLGKAGAAPAAAKRGRPAGSTKKPAGAPRAKVKAKYRHPENAGMTWTGRGRKPQWVASWIAEGKPIEGLLIK